MTRLYLYALLPAPPPEGCGDGHGGKRLRCVDCGGFTAAVAELEAAPAADAAALCVHDAVVRRLVTLADAVVPMRFGQTFASEVELRQKLAPQQERLREALARVAGCEQWHVRLSRGEADAAATNEPASLQGGPGTRFLRARARAAHAAEVSRLRMAAGALVLAERVEPAPPGQRYAATVYHLVRRGTGADWQQRVAAAAAELAPLQITISGPHPAYAFAGSELAQVEPEHRER